MQYVSTQAIGANERAKRHARYGKRAAGIVWAWRQHPPLTSALGRLAAMRQILSENICVTLGKLVRLLW
jgi:hypothetical protein